MQTHVRRYDVRVVPKPTARSHPAAAAPTPDLVAWYMCRARQLRAQALLRIIRRSAIALHRLLAPRETDRSEDFLDLVADGLRGPITSIRSSAEILRDNPDLPQHQRDRFLEIVLLEDDRLARLVTEILDASDFKPAKRRWEIRARPLERQLICPAR